MSQALTHLKYQAVFLGVLVNRDAAKQETTYSERDGGVFKSPAGERHVHKDAAVVTACVHHQ